MVSNSGGTTDHWPRQHISLYCWLKVLWNPAFDMDAAIEEYVRRMYGPAADPMRELVKMQTEGWEKARLPGGRFLRRDRHGSRKEHEYRHDDDTRNSHCPPWHLTTHFLPAAASAA